MFGDSGFATQNGDQVGIEVRLADEFAADAEQELLALPGFAVVEVGLRWTDGSPRVVLSNPRT